MPELPEVEVVRRGLEAEVSGLDVVSAAVTGPRTVRRHDPALLVERLTGARLGPAGRVGKFLLIPLQAGSNANAPMLDANAPMLDANQTTAIPPGSGQVIRRGIKEPGQVTRRGGQASVLVVHLRMSGQLLLADPGAPAPRHLHARLALSDGRELRFVDPRTFGELFTAPAPVAAIAHLGPDPLDPAWTAADLGAALAGRRARLKALLMDQRFLAGLGNIYSDEVLFAAGLRFDRPAGTLRPAAVRRLHDAIVSTVRDAVAARGSTLSDEGYVDLAGRPGSYQHHHRVYGREGRPCVRCGRPVRRMAHGGRSTFFCARCQS